MRRHHICTQLLRRHHITSVYAWVLQSTNCCSDSDAAQVAGTVCAVLGSIAFVGVAAFLIRLKIMRGQTTFNTPGNSTGRGGGNGAAPRGGLFAGGYDDRPGRASGNGGTNGGMNGGGMGGQGGHGPGTSTNTNITTRTANPMAGVAIDADHRGAFEQAAQAAQRAVALDTEHRFAEALPAYERAVEMFKSCLRYGAHGDVEAKLQVYVQRAAVLRSHVESERKT